MHLGSGLQSLPGRMPASLKTASLLASPDAPPAAQKSNWCTCKLEVLAMNSSSLPIMHPLVMLLHPQEHEAHVAAMPLQPPHDLKIRDASAELDRW